jgi:hypothetical protein
MNVRSASAKDITEFSKAIISMTSTSLKKSRRWNSVMAGITMRGKEGQPFTPPLFSHIYRTTTIGEKNVHGSWYTWDITMHSPVATSEIYNSGKQFAIDMGKSKVAALPPF